MGTLTSSFLETRSILLSHCNTKSSPSGTFLSNVRSENDLGPTFRIGRFLAVPEGSAQANGRVSGHSTRSREWTPRCKWNISVLFLEKQRRNLEFQVGSRCGETRAPVGRLKPFFRVAKDFEHPIDQVHDPVFRHRRRRVECRLLPREVTGQRRFCYLDEREAAVPLDVAFALLSAILSSMLGTTLRQRLLLRVAL